MGTVTQFRARRDPYPEAREEIAATLNIPLDDVTRNIIRTLASEDPLFLQKFTRSPFLAKDIRLRRMVMDFLQWCIEGESSVVSQIG